MLNMPFSILVGGINVQNGFKRKIVFFIITSLLLLSACGNQKLPNDQSIDIGENLQNEQPPEQAEIKDGEPITPEEFIARFQQHDYAFIYAHTTMEFQQSISLEDLAELGEPFNSDVTEYLLEAKTPLNGNYKYIWIDDQRTKSVSIYLDEDHLIDGLWIYPVTTYPETDTAYSKIEYSLPLKGEWFTLWGGTNEIVNYHYTFEEQRYAYDFVILKNDFSFHDEKETNENYYAYGESVYAPADGTVVAVESEVKNNVPGSMDPFHPEGNYIVIDHGNGEYSMLAHLDEGSISVNVGDDVIRGQEIARCGNSGNSSEPHIHFQVMDSPDIKNAVSINPRIKGYDKIVQGDFVVGY